jgi:hypothetical protein
MRSIKRLQMLQLPKLQTLLLQLRSSRDWNMFRV